MVENFKSKLTVFWFLSRKAQESPSHFTDITFLQPISHKEAPKSDFNVSLMQAKIMPSKIPFAESLKCLIRTQLQATAHRRGSFSCCLVKGNNCHGQQCAEVAEALGTASRLGFAQCSISTDGWLGGCLGLGHVHLLKLECLNLYSLWQILPQYHTLCSLSNHSWRASRSRNAAQILLTTRLD